ncbi:unnamed protein product [Rotaria socialis]|uniref:Uncharacterized protein n=2 Tax=Rotaria socialis TaxID=392032 RepID=A0A817SWY6_9BILA|nr:unnamed protein product [Rotaria socialis]CAF3327843.1 unnamed protein product [Rotaria socialis]CAF3656391.1 unnamed protein product [Rotaria socialis]
MDKTVSITYINHDYLTGKYKGYYQLEKMSHASDPSRRVESDDQSKRSSDHTSGRRGSSPAQNQQQQAGAGETKVRGERKRVPRSSSSSTSDSTVSGSGKVNITVSQKQSSSENYKGQREAGTAQVKSKSGHKHEHHGGLFTTQQGGYTIGNMGGLGIEQKEGYVGTQQGAVGGSFGGTTVSGERRKGRHRQEVIRLPEQAQGQVRQVRHRMPTPEPDTLERVYIQRTAAEVVEEITEIPQTPPPRVQERTVVEPAGPPQVVKRVIRVPPRGGAYGGQEAQTGANVQYSDNLLNAGNYYNNQQAPTNFSGGFADVGAFSGNNYGPANGNFQQQAPISFAVGGPGASSQPTPGIGCQPAFCFYM